jgi:hypothetical protein
MFVYKTVLKRRTCHNNVNKRGLEFGEKNDFMSAESRPIASGEKEDILY